MQLLPVAAAVAAGQWLEFSDVNAVDGSGLACVDIPGRFKCVGTLPNATACESTCTSSESCGIWAWSSRTQHCWWRLDGDWTPTKAAGVSSGCRQSGAGCVLGCGACPLPKPRTTAVSVRYNTSAKVGRVSANHPAVTLDWWRFDDKQYGFQWANASILTLDLTNETLKTLAKGLAPGLLRLGGSPLDSIEYDFDGTCVRHEGTPGGSEHFSCSQTGVRAYGCLSPQRWREILAFAAETGLRMVFGLNACNGRTSRDSPMDFTNIRQLLNYTASLPPADRSGLVGFEFGNEVCGTGVTDVQWAKDAMVVKQLIDEAFGADALPLIGPDCGGDGSWAAILKTAPASTFKALTYHQYVQCQPELGKGYVLEPACVAHIESQAAHSAGIVAGYPLEAWAGETAAHTASGGDFGEYMRTFQSSFFYARQTAALPVQGVTLGAHQCLVGGNYGLLDRYSMEPNPDYWVAWFFRRLFDGPMAGRPVPIAPPATGDEGLAAFGFVAADGLHVMAVLINYRVETQYNITLDGFGAGARTEWHLAGFPNVSSTAVTVNGRRWGLRNGVLPALADAGKTVAGEAPLQAAPASVVFAVAAMQ